MSIPDSSLTKLSGDASGKKLATTYRTKESNNVEPELRESLEEDLDEMETMPVRRV